MDTKQFIEYETVRDLKNKSEIMITEGIRPHMHLMWEVLCVTQGKIRVCINDETRILNAGETAVSASLDVHRYDLMEKDAIGYALMISPKHLERLNVILGDQTLCGHFISGDEHREIEQLIKIGEHYADINDMVFNGIIEAILGVVIQTLKLNRRIESKNETNMMRQVLIYLSENFMNDISLESVSKRFGYSPNFFSKIFNSYMKCGLREYINILKCEHSESMILNGENITEAAYNSGFTCMRTFYRVFREHFGMSPKKYIDNRIKNSKKA